MGEGWGLGGLGLGGGVVVAVGGRVERCVGREVEERSVRAGMRGLGELGGVGRKGYGVGGWEGGESGSERDGWVVVVVVVVGMGM